MNTNLAQSNNTVDLQHLRPTVNDEIDLGQLIRNIIRDWKLIVIITSLGTIFSVIATFVLPKVYQVESVVKIPAASQLGQATEQNLVSLNDEMAFTLFLNQLNSPDIQLSAFKKSELNQTLKSTAKNQYDSESAFLEIRNNLTINRISHKYYELAKDEKAPLKEIKLETLTEHPQESTQYLSILIAEANAEAIRSFETTTIKKKEDLLKSLKLQLQALENSTKSAREAQIRRLEETNELEIAKLYQQLNTLKTNAKQDRLNRITQLEEAFKTAENLNIQEPVTWDDLRTKKSSSQIVNELGDNKSEPLYFNGTRILQADITRLKSRTDDTAFIESYNQIVQQISDLKQDPTIASLKARSNDMIYVEGYDELLQKISNIENQPTNFNDTTFSAVSLQPIASRDPVKPNRKLIVMAGFVLSGFFAIFIVLLKGAIKPSEN